MGGVLTILGWLLLALLALVLAALSIPYVVVLRAATRPHPVASIELRGFAPAGPRLVRVASDDPRAPPSTLPRPSPKLRREVPAKKRRRKSGQSGGPALAGRVFRRLPQLVSALLGRFRLLFLRLRGTVGLDDPADTGAVFGVLAPLSAIPWGGPVTIDLAPDFSGPILDAEAEIAVRLVPVTLLPPLARFAWSVLVRRG